MWAGAISPHTEQGRREGPDPRVLPRPRFFGIGSCRVCSAMELENGGQEGFQGGLDPSELHVDGEEFSVELP